MAHVAGSYREMMRNHFLPLASPGRIGACAALLCLMAPDVVVAQMCTHLPLANEELWLGGRSEWGGETRVQGVGLMFPVHQRVLLEGEYDQGGYETGTGVEATSFGLLAGVVLKPSGVQTCTYLAYYQTVYSYRERFETSRGDVSDHLARAGMWFGGTLARVSRLRVGWWLAPEFVVEKWEMNGRRVNLSDALLVEEVNRVDYSYHLAARVGGTLRLGPVGLSLGIGTRPRLGSDFMTFFQAGFAAVTF